MATAFAVYATNQTLAGGNYAASYGFDTSGTGTGSAFLRGSTIRLITGGS